MNQKPQHDYVMAQRLLRQSVLQPAKRNDLHAEASLLVGRLPDKILPRLALDSGVPLATLRTISQAGRKAMAKHGVPPRSPGQLVARVGPRGLRPF